MPCLGPGKELFMKQDFFGKFSAGTPMAGRIIILKKEAADPNPEFSGFSKNITSHWSPMAAEGEGGGGS
jgi:hypothetical protein